MESRFSISDTLNARTPPSHTNAPSDWQHRAVGFSMTKLRKAYFERAQKDLYTHRKFPIPIPQFCKCVLVPSVERDHMGTDCEISDAPHLLPADRGQLFSSAYRWLYFISVAAVVGVC